MSLNLTSFFGPFWRNRDKFDIKIDFYSLYDKIEENQVLGAENIFECGDKEAPDDNRYPLGEPRMTSYDFFFGAGRRTPDNSCLLFSASFEQRGFSGGKNWQGLQFSLSSKIDIERLAWEVRLGIDGGWGCCEGGAIW